MGTVLDNEKIANAFETFYDARAYLQLASVNITSRIDETVYLTNSATNLFKQHLDDEKCIFARQRCMRTQNLLDFYNKKSEKQYPTYFESYGAYVPISNIQKLIDDSIDFFVDIGFSLHKMRVRATDKDPLLLNPVLNSLLKDKVILDNRDDKYDHRYGANLTGRAIKLDYYQESQGKYKNLLYFILIIKEGIALGAELASSNQLILMRLKNVKYGVSVSKVADILSTETFEQRRFADCIAATAHLLYEGIKPNSSNTNGRTLKKYIAALKYFANMLAVPNVHIPLIMIEYLKIEYGQDLTNKYSHLISILDNYHCFGI